MTFIDWSSLGRKADTLWRDIFSPFCLLALSHEGQRRSVRTRRKKKRCSEGHEDIHEDIQFNSFKPDRMKVRNELKSEKRLFGCGSEEIFGMKHFIGYNSKERKKNTFHIWMPTGVFSVSLQCYTGKASWNHQPAFISLYVSS